MLRQWVGGVVGIVFAFGCLAEGSEVAIQKGLHSIQVLHGDKWVTVERNQDTSHQIAPEYAKTSRPCPPFCIQPIEAAPGVETVGELELLKFMQHQLASGAGVLIDARSTDWHTRGTIPGSINIPYTDLDTSLGADDFVVEYFLEQLGAKKVDGEWDYFTAKQLVVWCNGPWCQQSPIAIQALLAMGYPAEKIFYYRGGMQMWQLMGFPVVDPAG